MTQIQQEVIVKEREVKKLKRPGRFDVIIRRNGLKDEFLAIISIALLKIFDYNKQQAIDAIMSLGETGEITVATYPREIAITRIEQAKLEMLPFGFNLPISMIPTKAAN